VNLLNEYQKGLSYKEYVNLLGDNLTLHELHYKKFLVEGEIGKKISGYKKLKILAITESWCGDSLALLPIVRKIAEINGKWEIKVLLRDVNLELMNQFLTKGVRGIPMFLFLDKEGELLFRWGPRPEAAIRIFENYRDQIAQGQIEKQDVIKKIRVYYAKDRGIETLAELFRLFDKNNI